MLAKTASIAVTAAASAAWSSHLASRKLRSLGVPGSAADQPSREHSARPRVWASPGRGSHQDRRSRPMMHKLRARAGVRCSPHQPFRRLQPRRRPHQSGGEFLCPAPAHGRRAAPQSWRPASWRLCCARRLVRGSSRSGQRRARRPLDRQRSRCARQPDLEGLLATTRSVTASPVAQTHIPLRFSTIRTNLRRLA